MRLPAFRYVAPASLESALRFLNDHGGDTRIIAGGTDLLPSLKQGLLKPRSLISLDGVKGLANIQFDEKMGLTIGPLVKLNALETNPIVSQRYPAIRTAANAIGAPQLRQMGTVGGNLLLETRCCYYNQSDFWRSCRPTCLKRGGDTCNAVGGGKRCFAAFCGDLAPTLIALGATVRIVSPRGERAVLLRDLYSGDGARPFHLEQEEILAGIKIPPPPKSSWAAYFKYRNRRAIDFPLAGVAAHFILDPGTMVCSGATIVIGGVSPKPIVVEGLAELLEGKGLDPPLMEEAAELVSRCAKPVENLLGSTRAQRKRMVGAFVVQAMRQCREARALVPEDRGDGP